MRDPYVGKRIHNASIASCIQEDHISKSVRKSEFKSIRSSQGNEVFKSAFSSLQPDDNCHRLQKPRDRFDTNDEMEMLGQGVYGAGNEPLLSQMQDPNQSKLPATMQRSRIAKAKTLRKEIRRRDREKKRVDDLK